jgi:molybdenum cofactor synthesis domain-containing protein
MIDNIDQARSVAIVTISDTRTATDDISGDELAVLVASQGFVVAERSIVKDDRGAIAETLARLCASGDTALILTTGGTGIAPRDVTPEATRDVVDFELPGIPEAMRGETFAKTNTSILSRSVAGVKGRTLIINLPGSPKGVRECFDVIAPILLHALKQLRGEIDH